MKAYLALLALPLALAACSKGDTSANAAPSAPVAAVKAPAGQKWTEVVSVTPEHGYVMGNPNAPIKLVEYGSRLCPTCGAVANTGMKTLEDKYVASGKVSYEFRDFMVHGAPDFAPALLGRCAGTAPFFPLLEQMFAAQPTILPKFENAQSFAATLQGKSPAEVSTAWAEHLGFIDFVKQRGIPEAQARACLADVKQNELLATMTDDAGREKNVTGTPSFFLNGRKLDAITWPDLETQLKQAGA